MVVIPGKDRKRPVIMSDHYDTAYMEDCFDGRVGQAALVWLPAALMTITLPPSPSCWLRRSL